MISPNVTRIVVGEMKENAYIVVDEVRSSVNACVIDPGDDWEYLNEKIETLGCTPRCILLTHGHFDHVMAALPLSYLYKIPVYLHPLDVFLLRRLSPTAKKFIGKNIGEVPAPLTIPYDERFIRRIFDARTVHVFPTPGHTPGSVAIQIGENLFSGDTVFAGGGIGRTDFSYGDQSALQTSVQSLLSLSPTLTIYPGHGDETTVRLEREAHGML